MRLQLFAVRQIVGKHSKLKSLRRAPRQCEKFLPFVMLAPTVEFAAVSDIVSRLAVVADGCEKKRFRFVGHGPEIQVDGLSRLAIGPAIDWNAAVGGAKIFTIGNNRMMVGERSGGMIITIGEL